MDSNRFCRFAFGCPDAGWEECYGGRRERDESRMECISISFRSAAQEMRGRLAFSKEEAEAFVEAAGCAVLLSTCNRTEVYIAGEGTDFTLPERLLSEKSGIAATRLREISRRFSGKKATEHLYRVTCGMDSMVVGEDEILGQVREAYLRSCSLGKTGYELNAVFQGALACAKKIKTQTDISKASASIATLASAEVFHFQTAEAKKDGLEVLLIGGSGRMGSSLLKNLLGRTGIHVTATRRSHGLSETESGKLEIADYLDRYLYLDRADVILSATESPHYTLTAGEAAKRLCTRKNRLFLDIAVPADIDPEMGELPGCRLVSIDDFERLARENNRRKLQAVKDAQEILDAELDEMYKSLAFHKAAGKMEEFRARFEGYSFDKLLYYLRDHLDAPAFESLLGALDGEKSSSHAGWEERAGENDAAVKRVMQEEGEWGQEERERNRDERERSRGESVCSMEGKGAFPFYMDIAGKRGVILGGGKVAARKIRKLLPFGPRLVCISPVIGEEILCMAKEGEGVELCRRKAREADLEGAFFVIAATDEKDVNGWAAELCRRKGILINAVDDRKNCTFLFPALICDGPVTVGISTGGNSPAAAAYLRKKLGEAIPEGMGETTEQLGRLRETVLNRLCGQSDRETCLKELFAYCEEKEFQAGQEELEVQLEELLEKCEGGAV